MLVKIASNSRFLIRIKGHVAHPADEMAHHCRLNQRGGTEKVPVFIFFVIVIIVVIVFSHVDKESLIIVDVVVFLDRACAKSTRGNFSTTGGS